MSARTIKIIDWRADFISGLGSFCLKLDPLKTVVLFPHNRPARHLRAWFQTAPEAPRPALLPRMASFDAFVRDLRRELSDTAPLPAGKLDQIGLLFEVTKTLAAEDGPLSRLPMEPDAFFPWGVRLSSLVEELLRQGVTPKNLANMGSEVTPWAAALLARLGDISEQYVRGLEDRGRTTPGLDHRYLAGHLDRVAKRLAGTTMVCAGFYALSGTERALFKRLWDEGGLEILWHTDPALAEGRPGSPDVSLHRNWLAGFGGRAERIGPAPKRSGGPEVDFVEGFDLHSQLHALASMLEKEPCEDAAIVLPETGALLPVLHHLPEREVNISMGYPLERTGLFQLVDRLLTLQEHKDSSGRYFWRDLLALLRHPYLKMLAPQEFEGEGAPLRRVLHLHEAAVRSGEKYQDPLAWMPPYGEPELDGVDKDTVEPLRMRVLATCLDGFSELGSLAQLADALSNLARMLHECGSHLWKRFVIDAEYLTRLTGSVIPELRGAAFGQEELGRSTLFAVLRQLCRGERVSFEPEPLTGLQVMGVLETRLIHFSRLFILDATEDRLPSSSTHDPLLPDPLRTLAGLPDSRERDNVSAYNFKRLLMGAERATLLYQTGVQPGLFDSKSVRSRYVEELIWQREKRERRSKKLITPGEPPVSVVHFPASALPSEVASIPMTDTLREALNEHLDKHGLSATRLDRWMTCPKSFYYAHLCRLKPLDEVEEQGDRAAFGEIMHRSLQEFLAPHTGRLVNFSLLDANALARLFRSIFETDERMSQAAWDVRRTLLKTGETRLRRLLANTEPVHIVALEQELSCMLDAAGREVRLSGTLDRVDKTDEGIVIRDYKTGGMHLPKNRFWDDMDLWERVENRLLPAQEEDDTFLPDLKRELVSVQLPTYLHLYRTHSETTPHDAALVGLAHDGKEQPLFGPKWEEQERRETVEKLIPRLLRALVSDMLTATRFSAHTGTHCEWCDHRGPCGI